MAFHSGKHWANCRSSPLPPSLQIQSCLIPSLEQVTCFILSSLPVQIFRATHRDPSPTSFPQLLALSLLPISADIPWKLIGYSGKQSREASVRSSLSLLSSESNPTLSSPSSVADYSCGLFSFSVPIPRGLSRSQCHTLLSFLLPAYLHSLVSAPNT